MWYSDQATGWTEELQCDLQQAEEMYLLCKSVQTGCGAIPASHSVGNEGSFPKGKVCGHEAKHLPSSRVQVKNAWSCTSCLPYAVIAWCLIKHTETCSITLT